MLLLSDCNMYVYKYTMQTLLFSLEHNQSLIAYMSLPCVDGSISIT
jgi:hypothetical protein